MYDKDDYFTPEDLINDAIGESTTTTSAGNYIRCTSIR